MPDRHAQRGDGRVDVSALHGRLLLLDDRPDRRDGRVPHGHVFVGRRDDVHLPCVQHCVHDSYGLHDVRGGVAYVVRRNDPNGRKLKRKPPKLRRQYNATQTMPQLQNKGDYGVSYTTCFTSQFSLKFQAR